MEVHAESLKRRYYADVWSIAFWAKLAFWLTNLLLPAYIAYQTYDLWAKDKDYREQPRVTFRNEAIVEAMNSGLNAGSTGVSVPINSPIGLVPFSLVPIAWSSISAYMDVVGYSAGRQPTVRSAAVDYNHDDKPDLLNITLVVPKRTDVQSVSLALFFDVTLSEHVVLEMSSAVVLHASNIQSLRQLHITGDVEFAQRSPISVGTTRSAYNTPIVDAANITSVGDVTLTRIQSLTQSRNETLLVARPQSVWIGGGQFVDEFVVYVTLKIPAQRIQYVPGLGEVLKFAFIQYFVFFVLIWLILRFAQHHLHTGLILDVYVADDAHPVGRPFVNY